MRWFYFVKSRKRVGLWVRHYANATDADEAFYDGVRLFYPAPAILYDCGCPQYTYHGYLTKSCEDEAPIVPTTASFRTAFLK